MMRHFNFQGIRGSSNRGGTEALLETTKFLKQGGGLAIAPDGPTGPSLKSNPGIILLARDSGMPIGIPESRASRIIPGFDLSEGPVGPSGAIANPPPCFRNFVVSSKASVPPRLEEPRIP